MPSADEQRKAELAAAFAGESDPYVIPGSSGILRNKLGILDFYALQRAEAELSILRIDTLSKKPSSWTFDFSHFKALHKHIFQDIYDWAGQPRQGFDFHKDDSYFTPCGMIRSNFNSIANHLAAEDHLRGAEPDDFVKRISKYFADINGVHPFREGNGRTQEVFFAQLALNANYRLDWTRITREEMDTASRDAFGGGLEGLVGIFSRVTEPSVRRTSEEVTEQQIWTVERL